MIFICFLYILCVPWVCVWCTCVCIHTHRGVAHIHVCGWRVEVEFLSSLIFWYTEARFLTWSKRCPRGISSALVFTCHMQPDIPCTVSTVQLWPCEIKFAGKQYRQSYSGYVTSCECCTYPVSCIERSYCGLHYLRWRKGRFMMFVQQWNAWQHCSQMYPPL